MMWFVLAIASALFQSIGDILSKRWISEIDEYLITWGLTFFSALFLLVGLPFLGIPQLGSSFWPTVVIVCILDAVSLVLYMKAIKSSQLSLILPLKMFTPLFLLLTSPLMLGEFPSALGGFGVVLIVSGSYLLNIKTNEQGIMAPFRALFEDRGAKIMLLAAAIWSITTNLHKVAVLDSSPFFYSLIHQVVVAAILFPFVCCKIRNPIRQIVSNSPQIIPIGLATTIVWLAVATAMSSGLVVYVIAVKRSSVLISICLGSLLFQETNIRERLAGASIMIIGAALIAA